MIFRNFFVKAGLKSDSSFYCDHNIHCISFLLAGVELSTLILRRINTRVRLYMEAPAETETRIYWDSEQIECLPLSLFQKKAVRWQSPARLSMFGLVNYHHARYITFLLLLSLVFMGLCFTVWS